MVKHVHACHTSFDPCLRQVLLTHTCSLWPAGGTLPLEEQVASGFVTCVRNLLAAGSAKPLASLRICCSMPAWRLLRNTVQRFSSVKLGKGVLGSERLWRVFNSYTKSQGQTVIPCITQ